MSNKLEGAWSEGGVVYRQNDSGSQWDMERYNDFPEWAEQIPNGAILQLTGKVDLSHSESFIYMYAVAREDVVFYHVSAGVYLSEADTCIHFMVDDRSTTISFTYHPEEDQ